MRTVRLYGACREVRCGRRSCPSCGVLWLMDTRIRVLAACQQLRGAVALVSVTAPGVEVLPWAEDQRVVEPSLAQAWNATAPERWSRLHASAARHARERAREHGTDWALLVKVWEYQRRGVLHLHLLVPAGSAVQLAASDLYVARLAGSAHDHGFGFVDRGKLPTSGARRSARRLEAVAPHRAAAYVASYVASSGAGKEGIAEVARKQGVPGAICYVSRRLTDRSGVTMRSLKDRRRVACRYPGSAATPEGWQAACLADATERGHPPLTPEDRRHLLSVALALGWTHTVDIGTGEVRTPTRAPAPGQPAGGQRKVPAGKVVGAVRLDSVLHRCAEEPGTVWLTKLSTPHG